MEHDDHKQQMTFSTAGAKLGLLAYIVLILIVTSIFIAG